jgi:LPXTG-motif cell wall-anchored protein
MTHTIRRPLVVILMLVLMGLVAGPGAAWAQANDGDGYPLDVDREVLVRDDVVDDRQPTPPSAVTTRPAETEVLGVSLARTGVEVLLLAVVGGLLALLGGGALVATRSRRQQAREGRAG